MSAVDLVATPPWLGPVGLDQLREALVSARFTRDGITARLGPHAAGAHGREGLRTIVEATEGGDRLATLIRVFLCGHPEPAARVAEALAPLPLAEAITADLVRPDPEDGGRVRAEMWLHTYGDWWIVADLPPFLRHDQRRPQGDYVIGIGPVSTTLVKATVRHQVETAADIGTGCGVQALHLSTHAARITATDLSPRALRCAATTAALNELDWELLHGDLATPMAGRRFDLVVANPPYIVGPGNPGYATHYYRDSGRPGDAISAELAAAAPQLLTEGGYLQYLANWAHVRGEDWTDRVTGWIAGTGCDAWIVQHSVTEPDRYIAQWLGETGDHTDLARRQVWLDFFRAQRIEAIGFGLITLRNTGLIDAAVHVDEQPQQIDGAQIPGWFSRKAWLRDHDPLDAVYTAADDLRLTQEATPATSNGDAAGWQLQRQLLILPTGLPTTVEVDPLLAALAGSSDGTRPLRDQLAELAATHHLDPAELATDLVPALARLVEAGMLLPVDLTY